MLITAVMGEATKARIVAKMQPAVDELKKLWKESS